MIGKKDYYSILLFVVKDYACSNDDQYYTQHANGTKQLSDDEPKVALAISVRLLIIHHYFITSSISFYLVLCAFGSIKTG